MLTEFRILRQDLAKTKAKKLCQANAKKRPRRLKVPFGPSLCEVPTAIENVPKDHHRRTCCCWYGCAGTSSNVRDFLIPLSSRRVTVLRVNISDEQHNN